MASMDVRLFSDESINGVYAVIYQPKNINEDFITSKSR